MRIELPIDFREYFCVYPEQPLCEIEMEMDDAAKTEIIKHVINTVQYGKRTKELPFAPVPVHELPLYVTVTVKWCDSVHGLRIDFDLREMKKRANLLKLGYGGLGTVEDVEALSKGRSLKACLLPEKLDVTPNAVH